jgi:arsenate reductase
MTTYVGYAAERVHITRGTPTSFSSSEGVRRSSCSHCGSPISYQSSNWPDETHLFQASFDTPEQFEPNRHVLFDEHLPGFDLYDDLPRYAPGSAGPVAWGVKPAARILFLCTGNSARSIMAEVIANDLNAQVGDLKVRAHSAGSQPIGTVNPAAIKVLQTRGHDTHRTHSKSWDEFTKATAPPMRWVITLCDDAAAEPCPAFPETAERPLTRLHWGLPDPAAPNGSNRTASFEASYDALSERIGHLLAGI